MDNQELKDKYKFRDRLLNAITVDGKFRLAILNATHIVETGRTRHKLNPVSAHALGELFMGTILSTSMLKGEERVTLRLETDGEFKLAVCEANALGEVRGYINNHDLKADGSTLNEVVSNTMGEGFLHMSKTLFGHSEPRVSSVALQAKSIAEDLTYFYAKSEQTPTAIRMGITYNDDFSIKQAVAFLVQALPDATEEDIKQLEFNILNLPPLPQMMEDGNYIDDIARDVLLGYEIKELRRRPIDFYCSCSKERFADGLLGLASVQLHELAQDDKQDVICHYCNEAYTFTKQELQELLEKSIES